jgi:hypothetical protein
MKNPACFLFAAALTTSTALAQATDVGMTMDGGMLTVIYGQDCGPVACTPFVGGTVGIGQSRSVQVFAAPQSLYAVALGFPGTCLAIPGIENSLLLSSPVILNASITSAPPFVPLPCQQGVSSESFTIPAAAPTGIVFRIQVFGQSNSGAWAFGPTIEATTA